jgi:multiple sugar transport system substrate-binding protein
MVDKNNKVTIDSPETIKALEYAKELYATFIPGTLSWLDPNNNKAFLDGQVSLTNNGISVYYAAKNSTGPEGQGDGRTTSSTRPSRSDRWVCRPSPPVLQPDDHEVHQVPAGGQGIPALHDGAGAVRRLAAGRRRLCRPSRCAPTNRTPSGRSTQAHAVSRRDEEPAPSRIRGKLGYSSAGATLADFIVVNMVAEAASGSKFAEGSAERAQKRAERYYKV